MYQPSSSRPDTMDTERVFQSKAIFSIAPSPPSPTDSLPPLTNSTSNSSNSPPQPSTPPTRYRISRTRYPNDLGRVPLHRRGTSQRYEPFEDLLREAGYKETRIFTPESERTADPTHADTNNIPEDGPDQKGSVKAVGAVVGFLSGLVPVPTLKRSTSLRQSHTSVNDAQRSDTPTPSWQQAPSPSLLSSRKHTQQTSNPNHFSRSSLEGLDVATPKAQDYGRKNPLPSTTLPYHQPATHDIEHNLLYPHNNSSLNQHQHRYHYGPSINNNNYPSGSSQRQIPPQYRNSSTSSNIRHPPDRSSVQLPQSSDEPRQITHTIYHPVPSRASAYLRHMASVPNMPQRPNSTPAHQSLLQAQKQHHRSLFRSRIEDDDEEQLFNPHNRGNGEAEEDAQPPMPKTWLETVARAVLFGGAGTFVGGPTSQSHTQRSTSNPGRGGFGHSSTQTPALRQTRSVISQIHAYEREAVEDRVVAASLRWSRSRLSDHTNRSQSHIGERSVKSATPVRQTAQPELLSRISRSTTSEGEVRKTRVVCRSAPTSRASSPAKSRSGHRHERKTTGSRNGLGDSNVNTDRGRKNRKEVERDTVPSLARTKVEGDDVWHRKQLSDEKMKRRNEVDENRHLSAWDWNGGNTSASDVSFSPSEDEDDDDEEDGELDLARMLMPSKRKNSIHSLRKHLISVHSNTDNSMSSSVTSGRASSDLMRRGSTRSSSAFGSGNSRIFRRWVIGGRMSEHWEDEDEDEDEDERGWIVGASREELQRRLAAEHEALERFLNDDVGNVQLGSNRQDVAQPVSSRSLGSGKGTRRGLPGEWVDSK